MKSVTQRTYFIVALLLVILALIGLALFTRNRQINADSVGTGQLPDTSIDSGFEPVVDEPADGQIDDQYGDIFAPEQ